MDELQAIWRELSSNRYRYFRFGGFLFIVQFILFPGVILGQESFIYRDFGFFGFPLAHFYREALLNGELPMWNPLSNMGIPFLAQWNTLTLYPGSLLFLILPTTWGVSLFCLIHQWFGGIGMYCLVERWTGNRTSASIAGVIFSLNGLFLNSLAWPNNSAALGWFPWLLMSSVSALSGNRRWIAAAAFCGAMQMLSGGPEIIIFSWGFIGLVVLATLSIKPIDCSNFFKGIGCFTLIVCWVSLLSAAQLLPFFRLLKESHRNSQFSTDGWSMPITGWGNFVVPKFQTFFSQVGVHFQPEQVWTTSYYMGLFTLVLCGMWLVSRKNKREWIIFATILVAANLALGPYNPLYLGLKTLFPSIGFMRYPVKFVILLAMGLPILAGVAWQRWQDQNDPFPIERRWAWIFAIIFSVVAIFLVIYSFLWPLTNEVPSRVAMNAFTRLGFLWLLMGLAFGCVKNWKSSVHWAPYVFPIVLAMELVTHTANQNPVVSSAVLEPELVTLQALEPVPVHGRSRAMLSPKADFQLRFTSTPNPANDYLIYRSGLFSNCNLLEGISKINGFYSLYIASSMDVLRIFYGEKPQLATPLKNFLGISHYSAEDPYFEWDQRETFMPFVTHGQIPVLGNDQDILNIIASDNFQPEKYVFLRKDDSTHLKNQSGRWGDAEISQLSIQSQIIEFDSKSSDSCMAVIAQNHYPCWHAKVDGISVPIFRANHSFQAVEIPPGAHHVEISYIDQEFRTGKWISLTAALSLIGCFISPNFKKRK